MNEDTKAIYKAAYLFSFTKLVDWPPSYKEGSFEIGILVPGGNSNLYSELKKKYANKQIGSQNISIERYDRADEVSDRCNILFISEEKNSALSGLSRKDNSTLLVAEKKGSLSNGAVINFVIKDNKLEYELSEGNAQKYQLTTGNQLQELALKVR